jgi:hypothetical protein
MHSGSTAFCSVCLEGLTLSLLGRVSLVESSNLTCPKPEMLEHERPVADDLDDRVATISLRLLSIANSSYTIHWAKADKQLPEFTNHTSIRVPSRSTAGSLSATWYTAQIKLTLPHVRVERHDAMEEQVQIWFDGCM